MKPFDLKEHEKRCNEFQEIHEELDTTYRRLHGNDPYPALSGIYISMFRSLLCSTDEQVYKDNIATLKAIIKSNHMEYYKRVSADQTCKTIAT